MSTATLNEVIITTCKEHLDLSSLWAISLTCKEFQKFIPYVSTPVNTVMKCAACGERVSDPNSTCIYHPGDSIRWTTTWEDDEGSRYSQYSTHSCCTSFDNKGCVVKPQHSIGMTRCKKCGTIFNPFKVASSGHCKYHPIEGSFKGADIYGKWPCCSSRDQKAPGCKEQAHHEGEETSPTVQSVVWSRLGTKVAVMTNNEICVFAYNKNKQVWAQKYCIVGAYVYREDRSGDCAFSPNGCHLLVRVGSEIGLVDLINGTKAVVTTGMFNGFSWGKDGKYLFFFSKSGHDLDYGPIVFRAYDIAAKNVLSNFVHFTHSNPMDKTLQDGYLEPTDESGKVSFRHPDLKSFIQTWTNDHSIVFEPYGNRVLFVNSYKLGVLYEFELKFGSVKLAVKGSRKSLFSGMGSGLLALEWLNTGFVALSEQNFKGRVWYNHHQYQVWQINDKLERTATHELPLETRCKSSLFHEDQFTLFRYNPALKCYFYAQHTKFFVLDENLKVILTFPWSGKNGNSFDKTYLHPSVGVAIYSDGALAQVPLPPYNDPAPTPSFSRFEGQHFLTATCKILDVKTLKK